jgi:ribosomal protein S18 acetylase RimI-like enzyme
VSEVEGVWMGGREPGPGPADREVPHDRLLKSPDEWQLARDARLAALRDAPDFLLPRQPPESSWSEEDWRLSWKSGLWAVAQAGGRTAGLARLSQGEGEAYIESVWTHPRYRRRGVASLLVRRLIIESPPVRGDIFVWVVHPNDPAFKLYESLGFRPTKITQRLAALNRVEELLRLSNGHPRG